MACSCLSATQAVHSNFPILRLCNINGSYFPSLSSMSLPQNLRHPSIHLPTAPLLNGGFQHHILRRKIRNQPYSLPNRRFSVRASSARSEACSDVKLVVVSSAITVILAVANRVLYKLALVPMKQHPFFMAQLNTFGYVVVYFSILYIRNHAGIVTDEMLAIPKGRFVIIGILEALGVAARMSSGVVLPGPAIPILNQSFLLWQLAFSALLLGRRYSWNKLAGCLLVAVGIIVAVGSGADTGRILSGIGLLWPMLAISASGCLAGSAVIKESIFLHSATSLKGKMLDIFVVNTIGSSFQALFVLLLLPFFSTLNGIPFSQLLSHLQSGAGCFLNMGVNTIGCEGAPLLPMLYIITNIAYNISLLHLVKISSALVFSLAAMSSVPISVFILSRPLPYLPQGVMLSQFFLLGSMILVLGLLLYNVPQRTKQKKL